MKIYYCIPHLSSIYAARTLLNGYKNAANQLNVKFKFITSDEMKQFKTILKRDEIDDVIIIINLNHYALKYVDLDYLVDLKRANKKYKVFMNTPLWSSPINVLRINENCSLKNDEILKGIINTHIGDIFYNVCEQGDLRMEGFEKATGYKHHTIPLAADDSVIYPEYSDKFKADISFIGTYLPEKRPFFAERVFPLRKQFDLKLYGQDWTFTDRMLGWAQRGGQYFNIPYLKSFRKPKLQLEDERRIYNSSLVSINVHEEYQRRFGGDCNERTFKIPLAGGFEITDDVACIRKYFKEDEEIIIAKNKDDWFDKINYYIKNPEKRLKVIEAGKQRVKKDHTYTNRIQKIISLYHEII